MNRPKGMLFAWGLLLAVLAVPDARAQITTGTIVGTVRDAQGGAVPGATVVIISEARGTRTAPVVTNVAGEYTVPNLAADTYTVEITMDGFKTTTRTGVNVSGGDRVPVPALTLEVGGRTEQITVTAEAALIQAASGERSALVATEQIQNLPISGRNFTSVLQTVPGVTGTTRLGGGGQNNIMMDGISAMDTGNNGQMLQMNIDAIQEVKVMTQGYQAEFGRSSGLQISAVTKGGTNRFHGSAYEIRTDTAWNSIPWATKLNGTSRSINVNDIGGYTIGGPVGKPGGENKLFFFYSHEYRPTKSGNSTQRFRLPTALELSGDFSQSVNNNGNPINQLYNAASGLPKSQCSGTVAAPQNSAACFPGNKIPSGQFSPIGMAVLRQWERAGYSPNGISGIGYNFEYTTSTITRLLQQPAIRGDYQFSPSLRATAKYAGQRNSVKPSPGSMEGYNDTFQKYPFIHNFSATVNYTINPTTFVEGTWGMIVNYLGSPPVSQWANRFNLGLGNFPLIFPEAGYMDPRYYERKVLIGIEAPWFDPSTNMMSLPPTHSWGNNIGSTPPNITYPGFLNINRTNDISINLTKLIGRHTIKSGYYLNHSYKAQNTGAGGGSSSGFQGAVTWGQDSNNPLDTGFGYANALLGIYSQYTQSSRFVEGSFLYNNIDFFVQDNWRVNNRLTLDVGLRFVHQQPQYDQYLQSSNFFLDGPGAWRLSNAPQLYVAGCAVAQAPGAACSSANRQAKHPITGQLLGPNTTTFIGTVVPGGDLGNGIIKAGDPGNSKYNYEWPGVVYAPRLGAAYDITGDQKMVIRGSWGLFYDRPDGNSVFSQVGNPPFTKNPIYRYGDIDNQLGLGTDAIQSMVTFEYNNPIQTSSQWNAGVQMALPWRSSVDVSYVGQHSYNRLQRFDINSIDYGTAFNPAFFDLTQTSSTSIPGANIIQETLRPYRGLGSIGENKGIAWNTFHSIQTSFNRRFSNGFSFGLNHTLQLHSVNNIAPRLEHYVDAGGQIRYRNRADQDEAQALLGDQGPQTHIVRGNFVWDLPDYRSDSTFGRVLGAVANEWQLSGIWSGSSGSPYELGFGYNSNGGTVNLTGTTTAPQGPRIILMQPNNVGSGCSNDRFRQFNNSVESVGGGLVSPVFRAPTGPQSMPAAFASYYGVAPSDGPSVGLESGVNYLKGCHSNIFDLALQRNFRFGGGKNIQIRLEAFNAFDHVVFSGRVDSLSLNSPTNPTMRAPQLLPDGSVDPARTRPADAGFGAVSSASNLRTLQAQIRFNF